MQQQLELFQPQPLALKVLEKNIRTRKGNAAATSIISFREETVKGTFSTLEKNILELLEGGITMSRRAMALKLHREPSGLCFALRQLCENGIIEVFNIEKCPLTGKNVRIFKMTT